MEGREIKFSAKLFFLLIMNEIIFAEAQALNSVADFHHLFDLPVQTTPQIPDVKRCELRVSLLQEELNELKEIKLLRS